MREEHSGYVLYDIHAAKLWLLKRDQVEGRLSRPQPDPRESLLEMANQIAHRERGDLRMIRLSDVGVTAQELSNQNDLALPYTIEFYPTLKCNAQCPFCYQASNLIDDPSQASLSTANRLVSQMVQYGIPELYLGGGEPLIWKHFNEFVRANGKEPIRLAIATNASLYHSRKEALFSDLTGAIFVSLHGEESVHNAIIGVPTAYESALNLIREGTNSGKHIIVNYVVYPGKNDSQDMILRVARLLQSFRISKLRFLTISDYGSATYYSHHGMQIRSATEAVSWWNDTKERLNDEGIDIPMEFHVPFIFAVDDSTDLPQVNQSPLFQRFYGINQEGFCKIAVMNNGDVYPSELWASYEKYRMGNIAERTIPEAYHSEVAKEFRRLVGNLPPTCTGCRFSQICSGGDPVYRFRYFGKYFHQIKDPRCPLGTQVLLTS